MEAGGEEVGVGVQIKCVGGSGGMSLVQLSFIFKKFIFLEEMFSKIFDQPKMKKLEKMFSFTPNTHPLSHSCVTKMLRTNLASSYLFCGYK